MTTGTGMHIADLALPGCRAITPFVFDDERGRFVKTYHAPSFRKMGIDDVFVEDFYSISRRGVVRGLHFQVPPAQANKLVTCIEGRIFDVLLDLRRGSPTYGRHLTLTLDGTAGTLVYLPAGIAHGFCALTEGAVVLYRMTAVHAADCDKGIRWDSAGIEWPVQAPILSKRDAAFPTLAEFSSPFTYEGGKP